MKSVLVKVRGIVQGVGFRPFVYRLAVSLGLKGYVKNTGGSEVEILLQGKNIDIFLARLRKEKPPTALIEEIEVHEVNAPQHECFRIIASSYSIEKYSMIPPDFCFCEECLREVLSENSRWYLYPFNSCAWCGPRFTIIERPPYDRENTSMRDFPLCEECLREYRDPSNIRRFHAQGTSCPKCGPKVWLADSSGEKVECISPLVEAAKLIEEGYIVAVKGIGGFHLACLATDDDAVLRLRERKRRRRKPFALMALDLKTAAKLIEVTPIVEKYLISPQRPIVVALRKPESDVSFYVAPNLKTLGVELAYTPLHYILLMNTRDKYLVMTSGNLSGLPICHTNEEALALLKNIADYFLLHNRRIVNRVDDSVVKIVKSHVSFLRRSRGYVPQWIKVPLAFNKSVVALGAMLSNTGALLIENKVILTQHIGDVENIETIEFEKKAIEFLLKAYNIDIKTCVIAVDKHPLYLTNFLAEEYRLKGAKVLRVQHHHAHIAAVMAEHNIPLRAKVLGIAIDGVGYGEDGHIWGGEILEVSYTDFKRLAHLKYFKMPGGDIATKYPARVLLSILSDEMTKDELKKLALKLKLQRKLPRGEKELSIVLNQIYHCRQPLASSTGRFLDAVSVLLGFSYERSYEGEPAILLEERSFGGKIVDEINFKVEEDSEGHKVIELASPLLQVVDMLHRTSVQDIGASVQYWLGRTLAKVALMFRKNHRYLVVSGGAAVNTFISKGILDEVKDSGELVEVVFAEKIPPGDGGLSLGQAVVTAAKLSEYV
ncbi:MAG: carbamoyltransferase HypF [Thermoprotei archaeon]|nr:MAG: carbamoyltransferase HypF [Thermoprotei archaeon]